MLQAGRAFSATSAVDDVILAHELGRLGGVRVDVVHGGLVVVEERRDRLRVLLHKGLARHDHARQQRGRGLRLRLERVPLLGQVQRHADGVALRLGGGDKGLGQHGHRALFREQRAEALGVLALPLDGHVRAGVDAVFREDVVERVLGRSALAAGVDRAAAQVLHGLHGVAALDDVEHAEGVDGQHLHPALGVVVEHGGQVRGHGRDVHIALHEVGRHLVTEATIWKS